MNFRPPWIVGIVNITDDSFSDGGRYRQAPAAIAHALALRGDGADVVELGPASSHPDARVVTAAEESERLLPVLDQLVPLGIPLAVDSFLPETQQLALRQGVAYLNDTSSFAESPIIAELAATMCNLVLVHSVQATGRTHRVTTNPKQIWQSIEAYFDERIESLDAVGIDRDRVVLDPGLGFFLGANPEPSLEVLGNIGRLRDRYSLPVMISASRKSFLRSVTGRGVADIGAATLAAELHAALDNVDYIRTHDVAALADGLRTFQALRQCR